MRLRVLDLAIPGAVALTILTGCGGPDAPALDGVVRSDSAGVEIVVSSTVGSHVSEWSVGDDPAVAIGSIQGGPEYSFAYIGEALILPDGRYLVGDMQTTELRVFSSDGTYEETWGRAGEGPGEFGTVWSLHRYRGDSILVGEIAARRITVLDADGAYGRTLTPRVTPFGGPFDEASPAQSCCRLHGALSDGSLVIAHPEMIPARPGSPRPSTMAVVTVGPDGRGEDTLTVLVGATYHPASGRLGQPSHFRPRTLIASFGHGVYVTEGREYSVSLLDRSGVPVRIVRTDAPPRPVADALKEELEEVLRELLAESDELHAEGMRRMLARPYPESLPAMTRLLVDADGNLWVGHELEYGVGDFSEYEVFDPSGALVAVIDVPTGLRLLDASSDQLIGVWTDELDVQYLRAYEIVKER